MTMLSAIERTAIERAQAAPMLERTLEWAAINSGTRNLAGLSAMAAALADAFSVLPGTLELVEPEVVETVTPGGVVEPLAHGRHLLLTVRPEAPVQLLLTGHMDTVFAADHPFQQARWLDDGRLNAPGAADMKGGLSLMLAALEAAEASPLAARFGYTVLINSDEETGSLSSRALIANVARGKTAALTYEPALPDGTLAGARGGTGNFSLVVHGRSAHAGRNPEEGRNALVAAAALAVLLADAKAPGLSVNPARIDGGGPNNVVPDLAILRVNFRPGDAAATARAGRARCRDRAGFGRARGPHRTARQFQPSAQADRPGRRAPVRPRPRCRRRSRHPDRLEGDRRRVRRQQHRRLRGARGRHHGRARRRHSFDGGISDPRKPARARRAFGAHDPAPD